MAVVVPLSARTPPVTLGVTAPPVLLKVRVASVLLPVSVRTPPPLMVTLLVEAMEPLFVLWVAFALFRTRLPGTWMPPRTEPVPPIWSVPWFTTVLPVKVFEKVGIGALKVIRTFVPAAAAAAEIVMLVPLAMVAIVAPLGMFAPKTVMPTARFAVLLRALMVVEAAVVPVRLTFGT